MRHEAENISGAIADAGNVFDRAIRIRFRNYATLRIGIAQDDLSMRIQFTQRRCVGKEAAFTVRERNAQRRNRQACLA